MNRDCLITELLPSLLPLGGVESARLAIAEVFLRRGHRVDILLADEPSDLKGTVPEGVRVIVGGVADDLAKLSGIARKRFDVIHNPITLLSLGAHAEQKAAEAAWGGWNGRRILTVGRLKAQKNHALLIRAFKQLLATQDARLLILGTGDLAEQTASVARAEGIGDKVLMQGATRDPAPFYRSADLFVLSSDYEGFGNVIVEALACGLPVVSTDCRSGPAEILENGRYGRLVPVGHAQALARAMADALAAEHDREAFKRRAADFSPEHVADQYLRLLFPGSNKDFFSNA